MSLRPQSIFFFHFYRPQRSWGKVMFSQASVILSTGGVCSRGRGCLVSGGRWSLVETPRDGYCCGRYTSYWNAFLFSFFIGRVWWAERGVEVYASYGIDQTNTWVNWRFLTTFFPSIQCLASQIVPFPETD